MYVLIQSVNKKQTSKTLYTVSKCEVNKTTSGKNNTYNSILQQN